MCFVLIADLAGRDAPCDCGRGASINCGVRSADTTTESCRGSVERTGVGHRWLSRLTAGVQVSSTFPSMQTLEALEKKVFVFSELENVTWIKKIKNLKMFTMKWQWIMYSIYFKRVACSHEQQILTDFLASENGILAYGQNVLKVIKPRTSGKISKIIREMSHLENKRVLKHILTYFVDEILSRWCVKLVENLLMCRICSVKHP